MKKNSFILGMAIGIVFPFMAYMLYFFKLDTIQPVEKKITYYVVAALLNLLVVRYYYRHNYPQTARGVVLITFLAAMSLFFSTGMRI